MDLSVLPEQPVVSSVSKSNAMKIWLGSSETESACIVTVGGSHVKHIVIRNGSLSAAHDVFYDSPFYRVGVERCRILVGQASAPVQSYVSLSPRRWCCVQWIRGWSDG